LSEPEPTTHRHRIIDPALLSVAFFWGTGNVAVKWILGVIDPAALYAVRMGFMALMMGWIVYRRWRPISGRDALVLLAAGGAMIAAQQVTFGYAMSMTTASEGSLLISTAPLWTAIVAAALGMEIVTRLNWIGIVAAFTGVGMVVLGHTGGPSPEAPARMAGDALMILSSFIYGGYMIVSKRWMVRLGALHVICFSFLAGGVMLAVLGGRQALATDWSAFAPAHWGALVYLATFAGSFGLVVWYRSISRTTASGVAVYQYLVPCISVVVAALFLRERPSLAQNIGIVVTLVGVYMARVPARIARGRP
jgi:O-acetylserine/cysteine efflux transporter